MSSSNNFPHELNKWIDEEVEVEAVSPDFDDNGKFIGTSSKKEKHRQKTIYVDAPPKHFMCKEGEHKFIPVNLPRYEFACEKCDYHKIFHPVTYTYNPDTKTFSKRTH